MPVATSIERLRRACQSISPELDLHGSFCSDIYKEAWITARRNIDGCDRHSFIRSEIDLWCKSREQKQVYDRLAPRASTYSMWSRDSLSTKRPRHTYIHGPRRFYCKCVRDSWHGDAQTKLLHYSCRLISEDDIGLVTSWIRFRYGFRGSLRIFANTQHCYRNGLWFHIVLLISALYVRLWSHPCSSNVVEQTDDDLIILWSIYDNHTHSVLWVVIQSKLW